MVAQHHLDNSRPTSSTFGVSSASSSFGITSTPGSLFGTSNKPVSTTSLFSSGSTSASTRNSIVGIQTSPGFQSTTSTMYQGSRPGFPATVERANNRDVVENMQSISAMPFYKDKSHEELRSEDYGLCNACYKGGQTLRGAPFSRSSCLKTSDTPSNIFSFASLSNQSSVPSLFQLFKSTLSKLQRENSILPSNTISTAPLQGDNLISGADSVAAPPQSPAPPPPPFNKKKRQLVSLTGEPVHKRSTSLHIGGPSPSPAKVTSEDKGKSPAVEAAPTPPTAELRWNKSIHSLTPDECYDFLRRLGTQEDRRSAHQAVMDTCELLLQAAFFYVDLADRLEQGDASSVDHWRSSFLEKEKEILEVAKKLSSAEEVISWQTTQLQLLQSQASSLQKDLEQSRDEAANLKREEAWKLEVSRRAGFAAGGRHLRNQYFLSSQGQEFLETVKDGLIKDYLSSPASLADFSRAYGFLAEDIGTKAARALGVSEEQISAFNFDTLIQQIDQEGLNEAMGIDGSLPPDHAWWMATFEKAVGLFVHPPVSNSWVPNPPFALEVLAPLQEANHLRSEAFAKAARARDPALDSSTPPVVSLDQNLEVIEVEHIADDPQS